MTRVRSRRSDGIPEWRDALPVPRDALARTIPPPREMDRDNRGEVRTLNTRFLPDIAVIRIEAFRGHGAPLGQTVALPAITSEDAAFWPTRPRFQPINELYARN